MAQMVGVSHSAISREETEASEEQLKQLHERCWDQGEILMIYIDGHCFGGHRVIGVVGVDIEVRKLGMTIEWGTTEDAAAVQRALTRQHGLAMDRKYLFVIYGAKACAAPSRRCLGPSSRCSAAAITRCGTSWRRRRGSSTARCAI